MQILRVYSRNPNTYVFCLPQSKAILAKLKGIDWWNKKRVDDVTVTSSDILYGYKPESTSFYTFNHYRLIAKFFIFQAKQTNHSPSFEAYYIFLNDKIRSEKEIAMRSNKLMKYTSNYTSNKYTSNYNIHQTNIQHFVYNCIV